jgi:hypothetical protein
VASLAVGWDCVGDASSDALEVASVLASSF